MGYDIDGKGVLEYRSNGVMGMKRNKNRGYQKLRVWDDAVEYYKQTWEENNIA